MKNQKGITLIALVITIIVLLILAGVSIAMLTGDNGILTQSRNAKVSQIEGTVREEVSLAVQSAKMYAEEKAVSTTGGWLAANNLGAEDDGTDSKKAAAGTIIAEMRKDLTTDKGYTNIKPASDGSGIEITYATDAYVQATNKSGANIKVKITVSNNTFTIETPTYTK